MKLFKAIVFAVTATGIGALVASCGPSKPRQADLPKQADKWVTYVNVDPESKIKYIGRTKNLLITDVTQVKELRDSRPIKIGDTVNGIRIGAIKCSFHWNDAGYGNTQFMWRGKWGCIAGRDRFEINNASDDNGKKNFDYVYIAPVSLAGSEWKPQEIAVMSMTRCLVTGGHFSRNDATRHIAQINKEQSGQFQRVYDSLATGIPEDINRQVEKTIEAIGGCRMLLTEFVNSEPDTPLKRSIANDWMLSPIEYPDEK